MGKSTPFDDAGAFEPQNLHDLAREMSAQDRGDVWSAPPSALLRAAGAPPPPMPQKPRRSWVLPSLAALLVASGLTAVVLAPTERFQPNTAPVGVIASAPSPPLVAPVGALPDWVVAEPEHPPPPTPAPPPKTNPKPPPKAVQKAAAPAPKTMPPLDFSGLEKVGAPPPRIAPSFDCAKAGSAAERLVCDTPRLSAADRAVAEAYRRAEAAGVPSRTLRRQQQRWLVAREQTAQDRPDALVQLYEQRMDDLHLQAERAEAKKP